MPSMLMKSVEYSRGVSSEAHDRALRMKTAGLLSGQLGPGAPHIGGLGDWQDRSQQRQRYGLFRG